jgi:hypothetical protein
VSRARALQPQFQGRQRLVDGAGPDRPRGGLRPDEPLADQLVDQGLQAGQQAVRIEDHDRLGVQAERAGNPDLQQLLQRAQPTRQGEEGVGGVVHPALALAHVGGDHELVCAVVGHLQADQGLRDHPEGVPAALPDRSSHRPHHRDPPAAGDQVMPTGDQLPTGLGRQLPVGGMDAFGGGTEDADPSHRRSLTPELGPALAREATGPPSTRRLSLGLAATGRREGALLAGGAEGRRGDRPGGHRTGKHPDQVGDVGGGQPDGRQALTLLPDAEHDPVGLRMTAHPQNSAGPVTADDDVAVGGQRGDEHASIVCGR